jgi:DNA-binding NarL/FixJ family response regulator
VKQPTVRVLIVDDQAPFRAAAETVVGLTDPFVVAGAVESAEECLAVAPTLRPDLVLMDIGLPGMDGIEATRRLAALPEPPVVILVSTYQAHEFAGLVGTCGATAYIDKSAFGPEPLLAAWAGAGRTASNATGPDGAAAVSEDPGRRS